MARGRLSGATAIVTGASAGIGEAIAKTFAREGASVAIASRNLSEARRVGAEIEAAGGSALVLQADVTKHLAKQLGPYGITVNTVSPGTGKPLAPLLAEIVIAGGVIPMLLREGFIHADAFVAAAS